MKHISFYKFVNLENLENLKVELLSYCKKNTLKGKILLADEGINGYLTGERDKIEGFEDYLHSYKEFEDLFFKENPSNSHKYKRMLVKIKKEIITFKKKVDMSKIGDHLNPKDLEKMYDNGDDFVIIDTRNDYEYDVGHFKNAIKLETKEFSQFPKELERIRPKIQGKKIVTYCTGGVRCEKATAYMKEKGFDDVYQLDGGIVNYGLQVGEKYWEGKCFVFDERGAINIDPNKQDLKVSQCKICFIPNEEKHTCFECGNEFLMCNKCLPLLENCCSKFCRNKRRNSQNKNQELLSK